MKLKKDYIHILPPYIHVYIPVYAIYACVGVGMDTHVWHLKARNGFGEINSIAIHFVYF